MKTDQSEARRRCVERWVKSGLSRREFALREGIAEQTLSNWKWALGRASRPARAMTRAVSARSRAQFVEIVPTEPHTRVAHRFVVMLPNGLRVSVPERFDEGALRALLTVLERC